MSHIFAFYSPHGKLLFVLFSKPVTLAPEVVLMLLELARPLSLIAVILSLLGLFHAAFLEQDASTLQHLEDCLGPLLLAAAAAIAGGLLFLPARRARIVPISRSRALWSTFPMRVFYCGIAGMALLFVAAWYFETYLLPYRNVR